jgi:protocatechuate 3,4-dioxygenase alpha subunit
MKPVTASQTIGPFWHLLADATLTDLTRAGATGPKLVLAGRITDGTGAAITDACVEIWQATPTRSPQFTGWGRCATDADGGFRFVTLAPDPVAPLFSVAIFARGLVKPLWTRVYLADIGDEVLASLPPERRQTLLAHADGDTWRWNIRLQGDPGDETVFFDL